VQPQKDTSSQPETRGRRRCIRNHPLKKGKQYPSRSASSTIKGSTTLDRTSTSIAAADMGMQRNVATTLTAVGVTTATKTEWCRNRRALESSAE
jgi:hypothetical protein